MEKLVHLDERAKKDRRDFRVKAERDKLQRLYETYSNKSIAEAQREAQERLYFHFYYMLFFSEAAAIEQNNLLLEQKRQQQLQFQQYQQYQQKSQLQASLPPPQPEPQPTNQEPFQLFLSLFLFSILPPQPKPAVSDQNDESEQQTSGVAPFSGFFNYDDSSDDDGDNENNGEITEQKTSEEITNQSTSQPIDDEQLLKAKATVIGITWHFFNSFIESAGTTSNMNIVVGSGMIPHSVRAVPRATKPKKKVFRITSSSVSNDAAATQHNATENDEEFSKYLESMRELGAVE